MGTLLWCLVFAIARVYGQCCSSTLDYCPPQSKFTIGTVPTICTSYGSGHIHTFDGLSYDFHEYGDFWLVNTGGTNFGVQARQIECKTTATQSVPISSTTELKATCNKAFLIIVNGVPYEFRHDINADYITYLINGNPAAGGARQVNYPAVGGVTVTVRPIQYVNPYKTLWRDQQAYLSDADFVVTASINQFNAIHTVTMYFYATGHATIQVLIPATSTLTGLTGLCGYRDGCVANDLALRQDATFNPSPDALQNAVPVLEIIRNPTTGLVVTAGNLPLGSKFINKTDNPQNWVSVYGTTWRVASSEAFRISSPTGDNYNIRAIKTSYHGGGNGCNWPSGWVIPQFIQNQCDLDKQEGSDPDGFDQLPAKHVLWSYCQSYCQTAVFPFRHPQLLAANCNGLCEFPQGDTTQSLHTDYNGTNLPPASFLGAAKPQALYTSQMNLGGEYSFRLTTTDSCKQRVWNITRKIECSSSLSLTDLPGTTTPSTFVKRNKWYDFPQVWLGVDSPKNFVRSSWAFKMWPGQNAVPPTTAPTLSYTHSLTPAFIPSNPGLYVVEFAVYDGCSIKKQWVNITAQCSSCVTASIIDLSPVKEITWGLTFDSPDLDPAPFADGFQSKDLSAADQATDWPQYASTQTLVHNWAIVTDDRSTDIIRETSVNSKVYNVNRYPTVDVANFAKTYPNGMFLNSTDHGWGNTTIIPNPPTPPQQLPDLLPLKGPVNTAFGAIPPQREFVIHREGTYQTQTTTTSRTYSITNFYQQANFYVACTGTVSGGTTQAASVQFNPVPNATDTFTYAARCVGQYNLNLSVMEPYCNSSVDIQKIEVECGPTPEVFVSCPTEVLYDYTRIGAFNPQPRGFPIVTIDASASTDPYNRINGQQTFRYYVAQKPTGSVSVVDAPCNANPNGCSRPATYAVTPDRAGNYGIKAVMSNGCNTAQATGYFLGTCRGSVTEITADFVFNAPYQNAIFPYQGEPQILVTMDSSSSATINPDAQLQYSWQFTSTPANNNPLLPNASLDVISGWPFAAAEMQLFTPGTYTIQLTADQGCGQQATVPRTFTLSCDSSISPSFTPNNAVNVDWDATIGGWQQVVLTPNSVANTFVWNSNPDSTNGPGVAQYVWLRNGDIIPGGGTGPLTLPNPNPPVNQSVDVTMYATDGCNWQTNTNSHITVNYRCFVGLTARITSDAPANNVIDNNSTYTFDSATSTLSTPTAAGSSYFWRIVSAPAANPYPLPTSFSTTLVWGATLRWGGQYILSLTISDGCTSNTVNVTLTVQCPIPLPVSARVLAADGSAPPTFTWVRNSFPQVLVDSNLTRPDDVSGVAYTWLVTAAPYYSIYHPANTLTTQYLNNTIGNTSTLTADGYYLIIQNTETSTEQNTTFTSWVTLVNRDSIQPTTAFPSCFYPDVAGSYTLLLTATDICQTATSTITIPVNCASKPQPQLQVTEHALFDASKEARYVTSMGSNTWKVQLSTTAPRRILLDARNSVNYSLSQVSYYWAWAYPDKQADNVTAQDNIETPWASTSAVTISAAGVYHLYLTVHDGCDVAYINFTLNAECAEADNTLVNVTVNSDGRSLNTFVLSMKQDDPQLTCAKTNTWEIYNFSTASNDALRSVASPLLIFILAILSIFFH